MKRIASNRIAFPLVAVIFAAVVTLRAEQPPARTDLPPARTDLPPATPAPPATNPEPAGPIDTDHIIRSQTTNKIYRALDGEKVTTGDGILDDMLQVIQQRGSILDGSSLDETQFSASQSDAEASQMPSDSMRSQARVAQSLLKSARLLEKIGKLDGDQIRLVKQMRIQAGRLLSQAPRLAPRSPAKHAVDRENALPSNHPSSPAASQR